MCLDSFPPLPSTQAIFYSTICQLTGAIIIDPIKETYKNSSTIFLSLAQYEQKDQQTNWQICHFTQIYQLYLVILRMSIVHICQHLKRKDEAKYKEEKVVRPPPCKRVPEMPIHNYKLHLQTRNFELQTKKVNKQLQKH